MKNLNKIFLVAVTFILSLVSCNDFLDVKPKSNWDINGFYRNETEVDMALAGIYSFFADDQVYGSYIMRFNSGTDESYYNRRYNDGWPVGLYRVTPSTVEVKQFWLKLYTAINHCNIFEKMVEKGDFSDKDKNRYLAEERFLRAWAYFTLAQWFGPVPITLDYTRTVEDNDLAVSSLADVYAQVISDFDFASKYLYKSTNENYKPGRACKAAAHGMLARVYMTMAGNPLNDKSKYQLAKDRCDSVMNDGIHHLVEATGNKGYRTLFLGYIQDKYYPEESIFEVSYKYMLDAGINVSGRIGGLNGLSFVYGGAMTGYPQAYAQLSPTPVVNLVYEDSDARKAWNLPGIEYTRNGDIRKVTRILSRTYCPGKYRRWEPADWDDLNNKVPTGGRPEAYILLENNTVPDKNFTGVNFPVLRYSDILLMYSEADNEINGAPTAKAIELLDKVRNRAGLEGIAAANPTAVASKENFFNELVDERMREFCFEGLRKQDLIRWGLLGKRLKYLKKIITNSSEFDNTNEDHMAFLRAPNYFNPNKNLTLPYPQQEVSINKLLEQKPEWK